MLIDLPNHHVCVFWEIPKMRIWTVNKIFTKQISFLCPESSYILFCFSLYFSNFLLEIFFIYRLCLIRIIIVTENISIKDFCSISFFSVYIWILIIFLFYLNLEFTLLYLCCIYCFKFITLVYCKRLIF